MERVSRIVLIGSGAVGSTFAFTCLVRGIATELVIIDQNREKAEGDVLDLNHGLMLAHPMRIRVGDYADCEGAAIIVIAAGAAQRPGESRIDLMQRNVAILETMISQVTRYSQDGILLMATNPVDVLTQVAFKLSGWPARRVIGSGTLLDSSRFRFLVAQRFGVDPRSVHGLIIGEHGDTEVPVWSSLNVAGLQPHTTDSNGRWALDPETKREIHEETRGAAYQIIAKKGATYYAIALALARICEAILDDQRSVLPVSSFHPEYGVCLGLPAVVGRGGVEALVPLSLDLQEQAALDRSAAALRVFLQEVGF